MSPICEARLATDRKRPYTLTGCLSRMIPDSFYQTLTQLVCRVFRKPTPGG